LKILGFLLSSCVVLKLKTMITVLTKKAGRRRSNYRFRAT